MKPRLHFSVLLLISFYSAGIGAFAGPSTTFWTTCTIDIQPPGTGQFSLEIFSEFATNKHNSQLPSVFGFEFGSKVSSQLNAEYGIDLVTAPSLTPLFLNAKIGYLENVLFKNAPALQLGYWGFGTRQSDPASKAHLLQITTGKSFFNGSFRLMASYYAGNSHSLRNVRGLGENQGYMFAFNVSLDQNKWVLVGDYASGNNAIGGGGVGACYYFSDYSNVLFGPVWFNEKKLNGSTKLLMQISIGF